LGRALLFFAFFEPAIVQVQRGRQELGAPPIHRDIAAISNLRLLAAPNSFQSYFRSF
jgi:hypothetical protein